MTAPLDDERLALLALAGVDGLGPVRLRNLLETFGSAVDVLQSSVRALRSAPNIGAKNADLLKKTADVDAAAKEAARMANLGVRILFELDDDYPERLREIPSAPVVLYLRGALLPEDKAAVAVVGSRKATPYGEKMATQLATDLARRGVTIVSGLARGIDAAAHRAAIAAGGRTIAVLGSGLGRMYPPEHANLAEAVVKQGVLMSESPYDADPLPGLFPQRNRIISGLSLGVVVVEAAERSGALLPEDKAAVAVVGSRKATPYGEKMATQLAT
ncbi:MAG: DNA-processing protein DprA, partial [Planctomycetia bacterium]